MLKVLLVDDEQSIRGMLSKLLEMHGFSVLTATSAAAGIRLLDQEHVDAVVTDLRMESPLAGFEVVRAAAKMLPRPAIIILTAFPVPNSEWKSAGADALVVKGMKIGSLVDTVKGLLAHTGTASK